ncbi:hypothetical protein [Corynebacterium pseudodiphtheriticum]|uniref:hypothetical protein n=1 Tax=Corynebacterium pseudodiphtheriticum TaxID=37637 RepID=UPI00254B760B|nr:hypothetical protein [Corynebacterium pseudodiphtheriticum]
MIEVQLFPLPASAVHVSDPIPAEKAFSAGILSLPNIHVAPPSGRHARDDEDHAKQFEIPVTMTFQGKWRINASKGIIGVLPDIEALRPLRALKIAATARISLDSGYIDLAILAPIAPWIVAVNNPAGPITVGSRYYPVHSSYDMRTYGTSHMYAVVSGTSVFIDGNKLGSIPVTEPISTPLNVRAYCSEGHVVVALPHGNGHVVEIPGLAQPLDIYPAATIVQPLPHGQRSIQQPANPIGPQSSP